MCKDFNYNLLDIKIVNFKNSKEIIKINDPESQTQIIDARKTSCFNEGHLDYSINIPYTSLIGKDNLVKSYYSLEKLLTSKKVDLYKPTIFYSGINAEATFVWAVAGKFPSFNFRAIYD